MASIAARIIIVRDRSDARLRRAAVLLGGAVFGLAVAAAGTILMISLWGAVDMIVLKLLQ